MPEEQELVCDDGFLKHDETCFKINDVSSKITPAKTNNIYKSTFSRITVSNTLSVLKKGTHFVASINRESRTIDNSDKDKKATDSGTKYDVKTSGGTGGVTKDSTGKSTMSVISKDVGNKGGNKGDNDQNSDKGGDSDQGGDKGGDNDQGGKCSGLTGFALTACECVKNLPTGQCNWDNWSTGVYENCKLGSSGWPASKISGQDAVENFCKTYNKA